MTKRFTIAFLAITIVGVVSAAALAHRNGCHSWHSCPSDTGSYVCGDKSKCNYCPNNNYCKNKKPIPKPKAKPKPKTNINTSIR